MQFEVAMVKESVEYGSVMTVLFIDLLTFCISLCTRAPVSVCDRAFITPISASPSTPFCCPVNINSLRPQQIPTIRIVTSRNKHKTNHYTLSTNANWQWCNNNNNIEWNMIYFLRIYKPILKYKSTGKKYAQIFGRFNVYALIHIPIYVATRCIERILHF